jgi:hypothetical protein
MKRILLWVVSILLLLLVAAAVSIAFFRDAILRTMQPTIQQKISEALGEPVSFATAELSLWPPLGVSVRDVRIGEAKSAARLKGVLPELSVQVNPWVLLRGGVELEGVSLRNPVLTLQEAPVGDAEKSAEENTKNQGSKTPITLKKVNVEGATVSFVQPGRSVPLQIQKLSVSGALSVDSGVLTFGEFDLQGDLPFVGSAAIEIGELLVDTRLQRLEIKNGVITAEGGSATIAGSGALNGSSGKFALDGQGFTAQKFLPLLSPLLPSGLSIGEMRDIGLTGDLVLGGARPNFSGTFKLGQLGATFRTESIGLRGLELTGSSEGDLSLQSAGLSLGKLGNGTLRGTIRELGKKGELRVEGLQVPVAELIKQAANFLPPASLAELPKNGSGEILPTIQVVWDGKGYGWDLGLQLRGLAAERGDYGVKSVQGSVQISGSGSAVRVGAASIKGNFSPGDLPFSATKAADSSDEIELRVPRAAVAALRPLLAKVGGAGEILTDSGSLEAELRLNVRTLGAKGLVTVTDGGLRVGDHLVRNLTGTVDLAHQGTPSRGANTTVLPTLRGVIGEQSIALQGSVAAASGAVQFSPLTIDGFGGRLTLEGAIQNGSVLQRLTLVANGQGLKALATTFMKTGAPDLTGTLQQFRVTLDGAVGSFPFTGLKGSGTIQVKDAVLHGVNLPRMVLEELEGVPFLTGKVRGRFPREYEAKLEEKDTRFPELRGTFQVSKGGLLTEDLVAYGDFYTITGQGRIGFDGQLRLTTQLTFDQRFSTALTREVRDAGRIRTARGEIQIPVQIQGAAPDLSIRPDLNRLIQNAGERLLQDGAERLLGELLGEKKPKRQR